MVSDVLVISGFFLMLLCPCVVGLHASLAEEDSTLGVWAPLRWMRATLGGLPRLRLPSATGFLPGCALGCILGCVLGVGATLVALHAHPSLHRPSLQALRLSETAVWLADGVGAGRAH